MFRTVRKLVVAGAVVAAGLTVAPSQADAQWGMSFYTGVPSYNYGYSSHGCSVPGYGGYYNSYSPGFYGSYYRSPYMSNYGGWGGGYYGGHHHHHHHRCW